MHLIPGQLTEGVIKPSWPHSGIRKSLLWVLTAKHHGGCVDGLAVQYFISFPDMQNHHLYDSSQEKSLPCSFSLPGAGAHFQHLDSATWVLQPGHTSKGLMGRRLVEAGGSRNPVTVPGRKRGWHRAVPCVQRQERQWRYLVTSGRARRTPSCPCYSLIFADVPAHRTLPCANRILPSILNAAPWSSGKFLYYFS